MLGIVAFCLYVTSGCNSSQPRFSFVYVAIDERNGNRDIFWGEYDESLANSKRLTDNPVWEYSPRVSPNGEWVLYKTGQIRTETKLILLNTQSLDTIEIQHGGFIVPASWSSSGEKFIYLSDHLGGTSQMFLVNMSDLNPTLIPLPTQIKQNLEVSSVSWSPDEKNLVLGTVPNRYSFEHTLPSVFIYSLDDKNLTPLTNEEHGACEWPTWSSTGEWIAMVCVKNDYGQLYLISPNGMDLKQLSFTPDEVMNSTMLQDDFVWIQRPQWLTNGENIVYAASFQPEETSRLYIIDLNGKTHQIQIGLDDQGQNIVSSISIQGKEISQ